MGWKLIYYQSRSGRDYVNEFMSSELLDETRNKVRNLLELLAQHGPMLQRPHAKKIFGQLWELRVTGTVAVRIFYYINHNQIVLLHAIKKNRNKLPLKDIATARQRLSSYLNDI